MIFYKPITDKTEIKKMFSNIDLDSSKKNGAYQGFDEQDKPCGKCFVEIDGYTCEIKFIEQLNNDKEITEGLIRSALNFAGNRNAFIARCRQDNVSDVLLYLGFKNTDGVYEGEIPTLLMGNCCKNKGVN